jgi:hypothetical protein
MGQADMMGWADIFYCIAHFHFKLVLAHFLFILCSAHFILNLAQSIFSTYWADPAKYQ